MTDSSFDTDDSAEVEIDLTNAANLDLRRVDIDVDEATISFLVEGVIRGVDAQLLNGLAGKQLDPVAVRFEVHNHRSRGEA